MKKIIYSAAVTLLLVLLSYFFLDTRIALFVSGAWISRAGLDIFAADIPDLLFFFVCAVTGFAWTAYFYRVRRGMHDSDTRFFLLIAIAVPLAFVLKTVLKIAVGRINTRFWLRHPDYPQFHWLNGGNHYDGFPSGHIAVFAAFAAAVWIFYPKCRILSAVLLSVLAIALIVTDYHFVSDIIAGACLGLAVHSAVHDGLLPLIDTREGNG